MVPLPSFWVDWFTHSAKDLEAGEVEPLHLLLSEFHQRSDRSRCSVELGHPVLGDDLPASLVVRVERRALEQHAGGGVQ